VHRGPASGCPPTGGGLFSPADRSGSRCSASHSSLEGDTIGVAYLAATTVAYLSLHTRALSSLVWAGVALAGLAGFLAGNPASLIQVLVAAGLAGVAFLVPAQSPSSGVEPTEIPVLVPTPSDGLTESAHDGRLRIRAIGRLALLSDGTDLAPALLAKRTLVFLWSYLLARAVAQMPAISRDQLADEVAPGLPTKSQRERLRKQLWDVQNDLPAPLAQLIRAERAHVALDLSETAVDAIELRELALRVGSHGGLLPRELSLEVRSVLDSLNPGEFLPAFEDYESIVNQARGSAGMHVNAIRRDVVRWRGDLAQTLAKTYVASGDPHSAVRVLEPIVDDDPGREDLAGQLVSAYMAAGQSGRASELRRRFDLKQEV